MNAPRSTPLRLAALVALALLAGCNGAGGGAGGQSPLAGAAIGGPFELVDQDGKVARDSDFAGRYRIIYFGYTYCPDVCPTTLQVVMRGLGAFAKDHPAAAPKIVPIFVSVDPARDRPAVMKQYVAAFGPGLIGLTGSAEQIARVAKEYGVYYQAKPPAKRAGGYLVDHSSQPILFGPAGAPIALLPADKGADAVAQELGKWVR